jgi:hypothetical protein
VNSEYESLRRWLEGVAPGSAKPCDSKYNLVAKLLAHYQSGAVGNRIVDEGGNVLVDESGNTLSWF